MLLVLQILFVAFLCRVPRFNFCVKNAFLANATGYLFLKVEMSRNYVLSTSSRLYPTLEIFGTFRHVSANFLWDPKKHCFSRLFEMWHFKKTQQQIIFAKPVAFLKAFRYVFI